MLACGKHFIKIFHTFTFCNLKRGKIITLILSPFYSLSFLKIELKTKTPINPTILVEYWGICIAP
jgi:hypothetical protein